MTRATALSLGDLEQMTFPTWFTVAFDYCATGEGRTVGLFMGFEQDAARLARRLGARFDTYFLHGAEVWPSLFVPPALEEFVPAAVLRFASSPESIAGDFWYEGLFHLNCA